MAKDLINGCSYSDLWVHPKNWKSLTTLKSLEQPWYVECKYYDPRFKDDYPKGFSYRVKVNKFKTIEKRKMHVELVLKNVPILFEKKHFNPILNLARFRHLPFAEKGFMKDDNDVEIEAVPTAIRSLNHYFETAQMADSSRLAIKHPLRRIIKAMQELGMSDLPISKFKSKAIDKVLTHMRLTPYQHNIYIDYLSMILKGAIRDKFLKKNPTHKMERFKIVRKLRRVISIDVVQDIFKQLRTDYYHLFRYAFIFFHSGARGTEILRVKAKNVDIEKQEYITIILKDRQPREALKVILPEALPYWKEILSECPSPDHYLFGPKFKPSLKPYDSKLVTSAWNNLVSNKYEVPGGIYQLKHRFLSYLKKSNLVNTNEISTHMAGHLSTKMTERYLVDDLDEYNEALKNVYFRVFPEYGKWE